MPLSVWYFVIVAQRDQDWNRESQPLTLLVEGWAEYCLWVLKTTLFFVCSLLYLWAENEQITFFRQYC